MRGRPTAQLALRLVIALLSVAGLTAWLCFVSTRAYAPNADGATVVLEGSAVMHGGLFLHGWSLSLDSFWTVDVLFYALGVALIGVQPLLMHLVPAVIAALCITVGVALSGLGLAKRGRVFAAVFIAAALVFPSHTGAYYLLQGPWHVVTTLYCLLAVFFLSRSSFGWRWIVAVCILGLGLSGDFQMLSLGVVPILVAGLLAVARRRSIRAGMVPITAAVAAFVVALVIRLIAVAVGTFRVHESHHTVGLSQLTRDVGHFASWLSALFGTHLGPIPGPPIAPVFALFRALVFIGVVGASVIALVGAVLGVLRWIPVRVSRLIELGEGNESDQSLWRVDDLLLCMTLGAIGTFGLLTLSNNTNYARYLDPVMIFSVALGARVIGRLITTFTDRMWKISLVVLVLVTGLCATSSILDSRDGPPPAPTAELEQFLIAHHLYSGVGDYWASSIVTVNTRELVTIRPVVANLSMKIVPDGRQATIDWYKDNHFAFLIYATKPHGHVNRATAEKTFGLPEKIVRIGPYFVVTWPHPIVLSPHPFP